MLLFEDKRITLPAAEGGGDIRVLWENRVKGMVLYFYSAIV